MNVFQASFQLNLSLLYHLEEVLVHSDTSPSFPLLFPFSASLYIWFLYQLFSFPLLPTLPLNLTLSLSLPLPLLAMQTIKKYSKILWLSSYNVPCHNSECDSIVVWVLLQWFRDREETLMTLALAHGQYSHHFRPLSSSEMRSSSSRSWHVAAAVAPFPSPPPAVPDPHARLG